MIRALVVDDEAPARRKLVRLLEAEGGFTVVGEAADGDSALLAVREAKPDVVFLDVRMPAKDGFAVVRELGVESAPLVVFVTAYDEYALAAFEAQALDYLLKPVAPSRFRAVARRVRRQVEGERTKDLAARLEAALARVEGAPRHLERILVQSNGRAHLVPVERIDRLEAARNDVVLHVGGERYEVRGTLTDLESRLDPARFLRLGRSDIVRLDAVREFQDWFHGDQKVVLKDGTELLWSRRYRRPL